HRCLKRHGLSRRPQPDKPAIGVFEQATIGFIHVDLKHLPALQRRKSYAFVAIDRATRYVYLEIHPKRDGNTAAGFLNRFLAHFPHRIHTILTDNGSEFTDRFAVDMKDKPRDQPSGRHPFDQVCANNKIDHRLTKPYRPQTNGLVERFNRRIVEAIAQQPKRGVAHRLFISHADRDTFLNRFVSDYNRTRLKCLGYLAPIQALTNPPGPNTKAGTQLLDSRLRGNERGKTIRHNSSAATAIFFCSSPTPRTASCSFGKMSATRSTTSKSTPREGGGTSPSIRMWASSDSSGSQKPLILAIRIGFL